MGEREMSEWLRFARDDLQVAKQLLSLEPRKIEIICYHCQQSAEKYLKALLAKSDASIPRTHELLVLLDLASPSRPVLRSLAPMLARLQPYAVAARYPFEIDIPAGFEAKVIAAAEAVASCIEELSG